MEDRFVINRKIENIIISKGLTSSHFADDIDVPRSSISHILANRNKPSLDIINKIIKKYPDVSFDWLMNGEIEKAENIGTKYTYQERRSNQFMKSDTIKVKNHSLVEQRDAPRKYKNNELQATKSLQLDDNIIDNHTKKVARVMVFYTDNTFDTFESK